MTKTEHLAYFHIPKTASTWTDRAIVGGCDNVESSRSHIDHRGFTNPDDLFLFCFVRHPLSWYHSFYNYRQMYGYKEPAKGLIIDQYMGEDFNKFIAGCVKYHPGFLSKYYDEWLGIPMDFVGRYENLVSDLLKALLLAGQPHDEGFIRTHPVYKPSAHQHIYSKDNAAAILQAESKIIKRFYAF